MVHVAADYVRISGRVLGRHVYYSGSACTIQGQCALFRVSVHYSGKVRKFKGQCALFRSKEDILKFGSVVLIITSNF